MPPIRSARNRKPPPDGFDDIEDTLLEFSNKMKDAENASHEGKKRQEVLWPIFQITHQRRALYSSESTTADQDEYPGSRYIYDLYYNKEAISKQLYEWLIKNGYADGTLIAKWKKQGYEKVCIYICKSLEQMADPNFGKAVLSTLHTDERNELQCNLYLSRASDTAERRSDY
ncbi:Component of the SF3b subcomplex of the U2 snRNP [Lecanora helva]